VRDEPISVAPAVFDAASAIMGQKVAGQLAQAATELGTGLAGSAAMAGSDPGGVNWASCYDQAAPVAAAGTSDLANACHQLAAMLEQTGFNHGAAESASTPGGPPPDTTNYLTAPSVGVPATPSANGGSVDPPSGWGLIESAVGYLWPNGDPAKLRGAGRARSAAASSLRVAAASVPEAVTGIQSQRSPEVTDAVAVCQAMGQHIGEVAGGCGDLAKACSDYADHLEKAHQDIIEELVELVAWTSSAGERVRWPRSYGASDGPAIFPSPVLSRWCGLPQGNPFISEARSSTVFPRLELCSLHD
jgi:hypothetical protein